MTSVHIARKKRPNICVVVFAERPFAIFATFQGEVVEFGKEEPSARFQLFIVTSANQNK